MIMLKHIKVNPMTITKVLNALKEDGTTRKSPTTARQSKAEDEH
jgi:DNA-binding transcriptional regulator YhcF (GntR family)